MTDYDGSEKVRHVAQKHPAELWYFITIVLLVIIVMLGFLAAFVPWAMVDISVGTRVWAYPFKSCFSDTFSPVHQQTCMDNDFFAGSNGKFGAPVTQGNSFCESVVLTVIAFVLTSVLGAALTCIACGILVLLLWSRPIILAAFIQVALVLILFTALLAWILWIFFAEYTCAPNSIFPIHGYSYGWICYIFVSLVSMASIFTGTMGFLRIKQQDRDHVQLPNDKDLPELDGYPLEPDYPVASFVSPTPLPQTPVEPYLHLTID
eukprot:EG_transcript_9777